MVFSRGVLCSSEYPVTTNGVIAQNLLNLSAVLDLPT